MGFRAATPGRIFPSKSSRDAPPPVEMCDILSASPACFLGVVLVCAGQSVRIVVRMVVRIVIRMVVRTVGRSVRIVVRMVVRIVGQYASIYVSRSVGRILVKSQDSR